MSLVDVDTWITEYDACDRLSGEIQRQIMQRKAQPVNGPEYSRLSGIVRLRMKQYGNELSQLSQKIRGAQLTRAEEERRRRQIETLQSKLIHLQTQFADANEHSNRELLFQKNAAGSLWEDGDDDDDDDVLLNTSNNVGGNRSAGATAASGSGMQNGDINDLRRHQDRLLEEQDNGLDALAQIISRQKHLALRIGDEVEEQNDIIDNLTNDVERVDSRLNSETRHVGIVSNLESSTRGYWIVIISLFVAIVIVAII